MTSLLITLLALLWGGLVGGFYAAGYSVGDIENILFSEEFQNWVNGRRGDEFNFYFSSSQSQADWVTFNLSVDSAFQTGISAKLANDLPLNFALADLLAAPAQRADYDFDRLYKPFRAVAAEVFTQRSIAMDRGLLSNALRTTMTVPFFYRPIKIDGMYLFDGGIYNNYPLDIMEDSFDPDIIIGVNVSVKRYKEYPYEEADKLMGSSLLRMILDKPDTEGFSDKLLHIEPELSHFSSFEFKQVQRIVAEGYKATMAAMPQILERIDRRIDCEERAVERNEFAGSFKPVVIDKIGLEGFSVGQQEYVRRNFSKRDGSRIGISETKYKYYKLVSESYFSEIFPEIVFDEETDSFELKIINQGKERLDVDFGGNISTRNISTIYLGLNFSHLNFLLFTHHLNVYTGRFYNSGHYRLRLNFPSIVPMFFEGYATYNNYDYLSTSEVFNQNTDPKAVKQSEFFLGGNMAFPVGIDKRIKVRYAYFNQNNRFSNVYDFISTDTLDVGVMSGSRVGALMESSSLDRKMYPSKGTAFRVAADFVTAGFAHTPGSTAISAEESRASYNWLRIKGRIEHYQRIGRLTMGYQVEGLLSNHPLLPTYWASVTTMDQYNPLNDSPTLFLEQFRAPAYLAGGAKIIYPVLNNLEWRTELHAFKPIRRLFAEDNQEPGLSSLLDLRIAGAAYSALVYHSPVGPIAVSANYHDDVRQRLTFMVHIGFILFNNGAFD